MLWDYLRLRKTPKFLNNTYNVIGPVKSHKQTWAKWASKSASMDLKATPTSPEKFPKSTKQVLRECKSSLAWYLLDNVWTFPPPPRGGGDGRRPPPPLGSWQKVQQVSNKNAFTVSDHVFGTLWTLVRPNFLVALKSMEALFDSGFAHGWLWFFRGPISW